jgi:DNA polymerase-4
MHVDINSCFATVEQQANPLLRGKPVVVAAYVKDYGCILAASREAKKLGIKTGMRVGEGKLIAPRLVVLPSDPPKYRVVNRKLLGLLQSYTAHISVESIDEMVMNLKDAPALNRQSMEEIAKEIKMRIKKEIGEWITVSCGIAPNRYLAKVASGLQKPDGLVTISRENIVETFSRMTLTDFCGIKEGNSNRLKAAGILTPLAFYRASVTDLKRAFRSITGYHWWLRLHGYEDGSMYKEFENDTQSDQKSFGQSYVLGTPRPTNDARLWQILTQLVMKMGRRLRADGFASYGVGISVMFLDHTHWHMQEKKSFALFTDLDFYTAMRSMLTHAPEKSVKLLAVYCYALHRDNEVQASLFPEENRGRDITRAIDAIQDKFGDFVIYPARMARMEQKVLDRISFGGVQGLPEVPFQEQIKHVPADLNPWG